jgi:TPR repeat protein
MNWLRKAAAQNFAAAEYDLGVVYETGMGVPKDLNSAKSWYKKAADQGYADAKTRLNQLKQ